MTLIFQHIPRTGGTTLLSIVSEVYDLKDVIYYYSNNSMSDVFYHGCPKVIFGHLPFGIHKLLDCEFSYVSMMRDPIERVKSNIKFLNTTVDDYITKHSQNDMTKAFVYKPHTKSSDGYLREAKENIKKHYIIGFTENFKTFVRNLGKKYNWSSFYYVNKNESTNYYDFTKSDIERIRESNSLDVELYDWAKKTLGKTLVKNR